MPQANTRLLPCLRDHPRYSRLCSSRGWSVQLYFRMGERLFFLFHLYSASGRRICRLPGHCKLRHMDEMKAVRNAKSRSSFRAH
mmetsp:Transcript_40361/g.97464  ORF Transcript_40361/g.97464 Transcript_40361/m.97464 type:complete len:84 (+) Transcript_40361:1332-1583(+)